MTAPVLQPGEKLLRNVARAMSLATVGIVVLLFLTAGVVVQARQAKDLHGLAAYGLHLTTAALLISLFLLARRRRAGWWAVGGAAVLFVFAFVQASLGKGFSLYLHIPGSLVFAIGATWLTAWLFTASTAAQPVGQVPAASRNTRADDASTGSP